MSFDPLTATTKDAEEYKASLLADISKYGLDLDAIQENVKKAKQQEADSVDAITKSHEVSLQLQSDINTLHEQIDTLTSQKTALSVDITGIEQLKLQKDTLEAELKAISDELGKTNTDLSTAQTNLSLANQELSVVNDKVKSENDAFDTLTANHVASKNELTSVYESMKTSHNQEITGLSEKASNLSKHIVEKTSALAEITTAHEALKTTHDDLVSRSNTLQSDYNSKKAALDKELADQAVANTAKESELATREGDVSLKEGHLKTSIDALRKAKTQLEAIGGSHININI